MIAVVQRVANASVDVAGERIGEIGCGLLVLLGVAKGDGLDAAEWIARKIVTLRVFADGDGKMNLDVRQCGGAVLLVSQFTLLADTSRGNRPGFERAEAPAAAEKLCEQVAVALAGYGVPVARGRFGASMEVRLLNDGPVTIVLDSAQMAGSKKEPAANS